MCIKFGDNVNVNEIIKLNGSQIPWVKEIKHLGNYVNKTLSDKSDCQYKLSSFIESVSELIVNLNHIVAHSMVHKHRRLILRICVKWNKSVRNTIKLPYTTHTWMLGPLN